MTDGGDGLFPNPDAAPQTRHPRRHNGSAASACGDAVNSL
ncbi:hypothetical protein F504_2732 [Ralstonia pseudosolanacearum FQY_4]|nr:hypothetical protein F504_2732 [Ralstonia pseudosolanacearum FQY_4]